jgi:hypothetical protein
MSDIRRVAYAGVDEYNRKVYVPDPNGTYALIWPVEEYERLRKREQFTLDAIEDVAGGDVLRWVQNDVARRELEDSVGGDS